MTPKVICVAGPTASGKTALAVELALRYGGEVVSCDSMQVYREMDIGSAKPAPQEQRGVPHHMLGVADPSEPYSAALYAEQAGRCVDGILSRDKLCVVCGGAGLYLNALLFGLHGTGGDRALRRALTERAARGGAESVHAELKSADPESAARIHPNDTRRVIRALEVFYSTGQPLPVIHEGSRSAVPRWDALILGLGFADRGELYARIDARVDQMIASGLADEARALFARTPPPCHTAMQAIGYKEFAGVFDGTRTLEAAVSGIKQATRRYAKRQMTWFRAVPGIAWIDASGGKESILGQATKFVENFSLR